MLRMRRLWKVATIWNETVVFLLCHNKCSHQFSRNRMAVQFWRLHFQSKRANHANVLDWEITPVFSSSFFFSKEKLIEQVSVQRYVSGNNTTKLFYFSENSICTIVYLIFWCYSLCVCLFEKHVHSAAAYTDTERTR